jgi:hypothetical protein
LTADKFPQFAKSLGKRANPWRNHARERAAELAPIAWKLRATGMSLASVAAELTRSGIETPRRKRQWFAATVAKILKLTASEFGSTIAVSARCGEQAKKRALQVAPIAWRLRAESHSITKVTAELERRKIAPPRGRRWYTSTVARMLRVTAEEFPSFVAAASAAPAPTSGGC